MSEYSRAGRKTNIQISFSFSIDDRSIDRERERDTEREKEKEKEIKRERVSDDKFVNLLSAMHQIYDKNDYLLIFLNHNCPVVTSNRSVLCRR